MKNTIKQLVAPIFSSLKPPQLQDVAVPLTLLTLMTFCFFFIPEELLNFDRSKIAQGEVWRLFTNVFTHSNLFHLLLNCASVILIWSIFHPELRVKLSIFVTVYTGIFVGICLYYFESLEQYVGFSGALYGIIVIACYIAAQKGDKLALGLMLIVIARIIYQQYEGPAESLTELIESRVAIESHLYGIYSALLWIMTDLIILGLKRIRHKPKKA